MGGSPTKAYKGHSATPRVLDLFAGAGGFSLGFHWAGFHTAVAADFEPTAAETLTANFAHHGALVLQRDLSQFLPQHLDSELRRRGLESEFDVIIGGPPCQGWSMVGRGKMRTLSEADGRACTLRDPRNQLYKRFLGYVKHYQPKVAIMENVPGMLSHGGKNIAEAVAGTMEDAGYIVTWQRINASDYGVPQFRDRLFFVGVRKDLGLKFAFPQVTSSTGKRAFPLTTVADAIKDLPIIRHGAKAWVREYQKPAKLGSYAKLMRAGADRETVFDHVCRTHNDQDLEAFRLMRQGGWYRDLPKRLKRYRDDIFEDKYKKLSWDKPSGCVTAHLSRDCYTHIHPSQARTISVREAARLQSFPDSFYFAGSMGTKFRLIGNAVPPLAAMRIANEIKKQVFAVNTRSRLITSSTSTR
jgi:DNA (cytosine-5)-methyltransferase 1